MNETPLNMARAGLPVVSDDELRRVMSRVYNGAALGLDDFETLYLALRELLAIRVGERTQIGFGRA